MFTKKNLIIGTVGLALVLLFGNTASQIVASVFQSPEQAAAEMTRKAQEAHEKARKATCAYIGQLTQKCYAGDSNSCMRMHDKEDDFRANYEIAVYEPGGCVMIDDQIPVEVDEEVTEPVAADPTNPVFFGDEEAGMNY